MFTSLKEKFDSLKNSNISAKINKLKSISTNNEEYVEIYNEINEKYTNLLNDYALEMDSKFNRIDVLISSKEVKLVKEEMDAVEVSI